MRHKVQYVDLFSIFKKYWASYGAIVHAVTGLKNDKEQ